MENNIKKIVAAVLLLATSGVYASTLHAAEVEHVVTPSSHSMSMSRAREHEQQLHTQMSTDSHGSEVSAVSMGHASFTDEVCADGHCVAHATEYELKPRKLSLTNEGTQLKKGAGDRIFGVAKKPSKADKILGRTPEDAKIDGMKVASKKSIVERVKEQVQKFQENRAAKKESISALKSQQEALLRSHSIHGQDLLKDVIRTKLLQNNIDEMTLYDTDEDSESSSLFDYKDTQPWHDYITYLMSSKDERNRMQSMQQLTDEQMKGDLRKYAELLAGDDIQNYEALEKQIAQLERA